MPISADVLLERMRLKNQLHLWRGLAILALVGFVWAMVSPPVEDLIGPSHIARIRFEGFISERPEVRKEIEKIRDDDNVKAVIVYVNSPGGTVVGGENLHDYVKVLQEKKPVVAVMGTLATSAAYMAVVTADQLFAHKGTVTGSIGVIFQSAEFVDLAEKLGISLTSVKSAPLKGTPSPLEKLTPEAKEAMQVLVKDYYNVFVDMVAEGRKMPRDKVLRLADGRVFTGQQAVDNKLVDAIGDEKEAVEWLEQHRKIAKDLKIKEIDVFNQQKNENGLMGLVRGSKILDFSNFSFGGLLSVW